MDGSKREDLAKAYYKQLAELLPEGTILSGDSYFGDRKLHYNGIEGYSLMLRLKFDRWRDTIETLSASAGNGLYSSVFKTRTYKNLDHKRIADSIATTLFSAFQAAISMQKAKDERNEQRETEQEQRNNFASRLLRSLAGEYPTLIENRNMELLLPYMSRLISFTVGESTRGSVDVKGVDKISIEISTNEERVRKILDFLVTLEKEEENAPSQEN